MSAGGTTAGILGRLAVWRRAPLFGGAIASEEAAPLYAVPVYPAAHTADPYRLAYCSQRSRSFDPATGTYLVEDGSRPFCQ
ncbi:BA14K family protein [Microvirga ossetica]|uniref:BA14K family protein n=1 Tax=Microvirga ossetica TaxID=1882682 RepID=UPI001F23F008|nr:BA14K family protein [Microvirga ossetica]